MNASIFSTFLIDQKWISSWWVLVISQCGGRLNVHRCSLCDVMMGLEQQLHHSPSKTRSPRAEPSATPKHHPILLHKSSLWLIQHDLLIWHSYHNLCMLEIWYYESYSVSNKGRQIVFRSIFENKLTVVSSDFLKI